MYEVTYHFAVMDGIGGHQGEIWERRDCDGGKITEHDLNVGHCGIPSRDVLLSIFENVETDDGCQKLDDARLECSIYYTPEDRNEEGFFDDDPHIWLICRVPEGQEHAGGLAFSGGTVGHVLWEWPYEGIVLNGTLIDAPFPSNAHPSA